MTKTLIVETGYGAPRVALLQGEHITRFWFPSDDETKVGGLYVARVKTADAAMGGAFLELGAEEAFLNAGGSNMPAAGSFLLIQIKRAAVPGKKAVATRDICLENPLMTWRPLQGKRKLSFAPQVSREKQSQITESFSEKGFKGELMIRPWAAALEEGVLTSLFSQLRMAYDEMQDTVKHASKAGALTQENAFSDILFDRFADETPDHIIFTHTKDMLEAKRLQQEILEHTPLHIDIDDTPGLFERCGAQEALEMALDRVVNLSGGGRLIFDEAEALTAIDVDVAATPGQSQRGSVMKAVREAIPVLFQQLFLRQIGGQVVIDFPALAAKAGGQLLSAVKDEAKKYRGVRLGKLSDGGLFHLTLVKREKSLLQTLTIEEGDGPIKGRVLSDEVLQGQIYRALAKELSHAPSARYEVRVAVSLSLTEKMLNPLAERFGARFNLVQESNFSRGDFDVKQQR